MGYKSNHKSKQGIIKSTKQTSKKKPGKKPKKITIHTVEESVKKEQYNKAVYEIIRVIEENPNSTKAHYIYGKLLLRLYYQGQKGSAKDRHASYLESAKREFEFVCEFQDELETKALMQLASIAKLKQLPDEAIKYYRQIIRNSNYQDIYAIHALAHLQRKEKRYEEALETLSITNKKSFELEMEKAKILNQMGRIEEASKIIEGLRPETIIEQRQKFLNQGRNAKDSDDFVKADFYYNLAKESLEKDDLYYRAVYEQIKLYLNYKKYDEAKAYCEELIAEDRRFKGEILLFLGYIAQAKEEYNKAHNLYVLSADEATDRDIKATALYWAGSLEYAANRLEDAEISFKRSISNARVPSLDTYKKLIGTLFRQQKYKETLKYISKIKADNPSWLEPDSHLEYMEMLANKRLNNRIPKNDRDNHSYAERQIIKYNEQEAIEHIKSHHQDQTKQTTRGNFDQSIDIPCLYYDIRSQLKPDDLVNEDAMEIYEIDYHNAGHNLENDLVHRVRVVVFPHTRNILTMYPGCKATVPRLKEINLSDSHKVYVKKQRPNN